MDVITIESGAFAQIMEKLKNLEHKFIELKHDSELLLSEKWLDNQDVIMLLKISKRTLQSYRDQNVIPYSQFGSKIYYKATDIEKFLKKNYRKIVNF